MLSRYRPSALLPIILALFLALAAPSNVAAQSEGPSSAPATEERLLATPVPRADLAELAQRVRGVPVPSSGPLAASERQVGQTEDFWVMDPHRDEYFTVSASLRLVTPHAYWYVQTGEQVDLRVLQRAADRFERNTYPKARQYLGPERDVGVDGDPRITILNARIPGVSGYYSSVDEYPREVHPFSNQRKILYLSLASIRPGSQSYDATLAHEFQHMVHWNLNRSQDTWIDEGSAELVSVLLEGLGRRNLANFRANPGIQLTAWSKDPGLVGASYEAAFLFMDYFVEHLGGPEALGDLLGRYATGTDTFDSYLRARGYDATFDTVFMDWAVANLVSDPTIYDGRFGYRDLRPSVEVTSRVAVGSGPEEHWANQYGAQYVELVGDGRDVVVHFQGQNDVRLVGTDPTSGSHAWWSNRGDGIDTRLTRELDLREVGQATLRFRTWYDLEPYFDFFYVMVSPDDGLTWTLVGGPSATSRNPTGNSLGLGYTGISGDGTEPDWVEETIDLTPFAGQKLLLRFEYVTDQGYNARGAIIDDLEVPEIGYFDDAESENGWQAEGFVLSDNIVPQRFGLRLVEYRADGISVRDFPLDQFQRGSITIRGLGGEVTRAVLVVAPMAPRTIEPTRYTVELQGVGDGGQQP